MQAKNDAIRAENTVVKVRYEGEQQKVQADAQAAVRIAQANGEAQATIAQARSQREASILKAEGEAQAATLVGEAQARIIQQVGCGREQQCGGGVLRDGPSLEWANAFDRARKRNQPARDAEPAFGAEVMARER